MTVHPLILAGAKALNDKDWSYFPIEARKAWEDLRDLDQRRLIARSEAVIRSLPKGSSLLTGEAAVLPVEAGRQSYAKEAAEAFYNQRSPGPSASALEAVAAHSNEEKGK